MAAMTAVQGTAFSWDRTPRHPSQWFPDKLEREGVWPTEQLPGQGPQNEVLELSKVCLLWGADKCQGLEAIQPTPAALAPRDGMASLIQTHRAKGPSEAELKGPGLANHSSKGQIASEPLTTAWSKGVSEKCNFHSGSTVLPKHDATTSSPFNPFSTSREKGDKDTQHWTSEMNQGPPVCHHSPFTALKHPLAGPVSHESAGELRSMAGSGDRLPTGPQGPGNTERRRHSHLQQDTSVLSLQQDLRL